MVIHYGQQTLEMRTGMPAREKYNKHQMVDISLQVAFHIFQIILREPYLARGILLEMKFGAKHMVILLQVLMT